MERQRDDSLARQLDQHADGNAALDVEQLEPNELSKSSVRMADGV